MKIQFLYRALSSICPIDSVNSNRVVSFKDEATQSQRNAAQAIADSWDFNVPTTEELTAIAAQEALIAAKAEAQADNIVQYLRDHTPAECAAYVNANVNNLADAKAFLGKVAMALSVLVRREFR